jgi:benzoyl-CoA reductase/2-hydroxyglutaryl-CoA dehydratase subunit BcrC/BadD/HgdB
MQTKVSYLSDLKFNLETWKRELRFHFNEMDTFQEKLEEIAGREFSPEATRPLEMFQNKITLEKSAISKLMHRCKYKMKNINNADFNEGIDGRLKIEQSTLRDDMRTYNRMHFDLKEDMMDYFLEWL